MQVDVVTSALPAGAATSAAQSTQTTHLATIAGAISGSEMQADVLTQPARAATTDSIAAKHATDAIMDGLTALTPKFAKIDAATSGDNTLVAAVASKKIRVLALFLVAVSDVVARFESGAGGTARKQHSLEPGARRRRERRWLSRVRRSVAILDFRFWILD
jgi:hypothetical protein